KKGIERATHRALYYSMGHSPKDLQKPVVGIVNSQNETMPSTLDSRASELERTSIPVASIASSAATPNRLIVY
ncbi:hypothetical protein, partial [Acetomicrobium sp. S15 = DSM 107314]|uniref:hypothetical protein n=1 Tax=Acetomicrobium sp. S15 = DSM 107314 TaxID=2529858 RepID=UPI0018E1BFAF